MIMNFIKNNIQYILIILFIIGMIYTVRFRTKFKGSIITMITKAKYGKLSREALGNIIDKIQKSDLDDRMVLVMAEAIHTIPFVNMLYVLFPKPLVVRWLNNQVQNIFNSIEVSLKGDQLYGNNTLGEKVAVEAVSNVAIKNIDSIIPRLNEQEDKLNKILNIVETLSNLSPNSTEVLTPLVEEVKEVKSDLEEFVDDVIQTPKDGLEKVEELKDKIKSTKKLIFGNTEIN